jgi:SNF2 family DNA or RNA helicase
MVVDVGDIGQSEPIDLTREDEDSDDDDLANLLGGLAVGDKAPKSDPKSDDSTAKELPPTASSKIRQLMDILKDIQSKGERSIVFSQFTSFLDLLGPFLNASGISHVRCKPHLLSRIYLLKSR